MEIEYASTVETKRLNDIVVELSEKSETARFALNDTDQKILALNQRIADLEAENAEFKEKVKVLNSREKVVNELTERIKGIETRPEPKAGAPGPQGKPGNIDAAVFGAEKAANKIAQETATLCKQHVADLDARVAKSEEALLRTVQGVSDRFEQEVRDTEKHFYEQAEAHIENKIVSLLEDYKVLDKDGSPITDYLRHAINEVLDQRQGLVKKES
jgi:TolA-binding protein